MIQENVIPIFVHMLVFEMGIMSRQHRIYKANQRPAQVQHTRQNVIVQPLIEGICIFYQHCAYVPVGTTHQTSHICSPPLFIINLISCLIRSYLNHISKLPGDPWQSWPRRRRQERPLGCSRGCRGCCCSPSQRPRRGKRHRLWRLMGQRLACDPGALALGIDDLGLGRTFLWGVVSCVLRV